MKTRHGFVSNSSSSSFYFTKGTAFNNTIEVAYHMLMERGWPMDSKDIGKLVNGIRNNSVNETSNLSFNSTNYATYIYNTGENVIAICTCNNIVWNFPPEVKYLADDYNNLSIKQAGTNGKLFFKIESNAWGYPDIPDDLILTIEKDVGSKSTSNISWCDVCRSSLWLGPEGKTIICLSCQQAKYIKSKNKWSLV